MLPIGILALQGGFHAHGQLLDKINCPWELINKPRQLKDISGLIIPGGESTTLLKLIPEFIPKLKTLYKLNKPIFGTCAGAILLAKQVQSPTQESLGFIDMTITRNGYGRQLDSFEHKATGSSISNILNSNSLKMVFIRAPVISEYHPKINVLAYCNDNPVLVQQNNILAATFHPELTDDFSVHKYFLTMIS